jgi:hypothetical protein
MADFNKVKNAFSSKISKPKTQIKDKKEPDAYTPFQDNWWKASSYCFQCSNEIMYLPISPQNISISTHFATNTITTLYSTVEEHSEVRYFDIAIQGTTGFAPKYVGVNPNPVGEMGRLSYGTGALIDSGVLGGFGYATINKINQAGNRASDALSSISGKNRPHESGVFKDKTGYWAFHQLYLFLLRYKKKAAEGKADKKSPLIFINYKDNNKYSCTVQRFSLERSADNPMLYNYVIQLRAYNLSPLLPSQLPTSDQDSDFKQKLNSLGLDGQKASVLARARNAIRNAKSAINAAGSAVSGAGR